MKKSNQMKQAEAKLDKRYKIESVCQKGISEAVRRGCRIAPVGRFIVTWED